MYYFKRIFIVCAILCAIAIPVIGESAPFAKLTPDEMVVVLASHYQTTEKTPSDTSLQAPRGILIMDNELIIPDAKQHTLIVLDRKGNYLRKIGSLGSGPLEFNNPSAIAANATNIYVLDVGNDRIQILNHQFMYEAEIPLSQSAAKIYVDLCVTDEGEVYAVTKSVITDYAVIYYGAKGNPLDEFVRMEKPFVGTLAKKENQVYAIDVMAHFVAENMYGAATGMNNIYLLEGVESSLFRALPFKYAPASLAFGDNELIVFSCTWGRIDLFTIDGVYKETLTSRRIESSPYDSSICVADDGTIYACFENQATLIIFKKNEDAKVVLSNVLRLAGNTTYHSNQPNRWSYTFGRDAPALHYDFKHTRCDFSQTDAQYR